MIEYPSTFIHFSHNKFSAECRVGTARKTASCVWVPVGRGPASLQSRAVVKVPARRAAVGTGWVVEVDSSRRYRVGSWTDGDSRRAASLEQNSTLLM